ncbi:antibiotic biosynthesis monooxygenase [Allokutzneria sp. A3M-2-11 16]|uniref:antibiotic biosynthesis monooxygenase family protein n=1 Tax=Allokutzneria sp. A3M-2-11 16 TaxID=2962043 RepID=UPI0020B689BC|nr:antibiotic biosynthesis monooxygenase family protein [Allokutzneria sp. A3M-2-11 16]MCP3802474.1 antibiotic biosynthesis monooxygenase [Allokutzneria sp. A3M-2-11 16]
MILEVAEILVQPGEEEEFEAAYRVAVAHLLGSPGCRSARLTRGVENPSRFVLFVEWDSVQAHTEGFRNSPAFTRWRDGIGRFLVGAPRVEHFVPAGE